MAGQLSRKYSVLELEAKGAKRVSRDAYCFVSTGTGFRRRPIRTIASTRTSLHRRFVLSELR